ncbi:MAG TPA: ATP-binding cassette domain-containing protein [Thermoanaerobaculia bacterium]|jgi:ABC-2 type transport system ATP-binding protein|nr:ATP-binding cassette domain-containing protein [Thermoanaerobaculia bacterium]
MVDDAQRAPIIAIRDVGKKFATVTAVDGITLDIPAGRIFALLGPNGAGKTTLLRMILGLMLPDSGSIRWHATSHAAGIAHPDARTIGYLPEDRGLYPDVEVLRTLVYFGTLRGMTRAAARAAALQWLERLELLDRAREPVKALSKGNQQKVQFISAVLHAPSVAVLDEPFSGLDPMNQDLFLTLLRDLADDGTTVLLSAHQLQLVERIADELVVINRGQVILKGTVEEVRAVSNNQTLHDVYVSTIAEHNAGAAPVEGS